MDESIDENEYNKSKRNKVNANIFFSIGYGYL